MTIALMFCLSWAIIASIKWLDARRQHEMARVTLELDRFRRSDAVSRGNRTRALNAKAKRDQITAALRGEG